MWRGFLQVWDLPPSWMTIGIPGYLILGKELTNRDWEVADAFLRVKVVMPALKQAVIHPLLEKPILDPGDHSNYYPVWNILFLIEQVLAGELQPFLDEVHNLDYFHSGLKPGFGTETVLVDLMDGLHWERSSLTLLSLLVLSADSMPSVLVTIWTIHGLQT